MDVYIKCLHLSNSYLEWHLAHLDELKASAISEEQIAEFKEAVSKFSTQGTLSLGSHAQKEGDAHIEAVRHFNEKVKSSLMAFRSDPEGFMTISETDHQRNLHKVSASPAANRGVRLMPPQMLRHMFNAQNGAITEDFRELLYSLFDGLLYLVECRRPIDIRGSAIQSETLQKAMRATFHLDPSSFETYKEWSSEMCRFISEVKRMQQQQDQHRQMRPGDLISFDLKQRFRAAGSAFFGEIVSAASELETFETSEGNVYEESENADASSGNVAKHSDHYDSVNWFGTPYRFTLSQAAAVRLLWEAWEKGKPSVHGTELIAAAESEGDRVRDIFKSGKVIHPAWGTMIVKVESSRNHFRPEYYPQLL